MAKRHKKPRRQLVAAQTRRDMYILAGLPIAMIKEAREYLEAAVQAAIVHAVPSALQDGTLYPVYHIETLLRTVASFAVRKRSREEARPATPGTITLLYVPSPDQERLLCAFDFAVLAVPLPSLVAYGENGRQFRHDPHAVIAALEAALAPDSELRLARAQIAFRISRYIRSDEALLLPPCNFSVDDGNLVPTFRAMRRGQRRWDDRLKDLGPAELTHDDMPKRIGADETRRVFVDDRGMAFPVAHPAAFDGPARELEPDPDVDTLLLTLRALYRFGGALPRGLHHDAQRSDGSVLGGATFHCSVEGDLHPTGAYANVYPNDFVREHK